ncbi:hypothetical protein QDA00_gp06 [Microbacterium phage Matzah]|jgi:hypothetical protein|uniref:Uncharacterized protein n=1 Tax=Microbacterium phage Matzah TaxID=2686228 RepID=A0A6B9L6I4_9CAUD|nr:hypothetical protein QDA00_gp06 [Microbacterium phage Matzah]QHB37000.1 hypothetical protein SEA_MATZAH_6 [Microbacterium phage Matzah]
MTTFIEGYLSDPIDPTSHAWCTGGMPEMTPSGKQMPGEACDWTNRGEWAHKHAHHHGNILGHVTHVWSPDAEQCGDIYVGLFGGPYSCAREPLHTGLHRDPNGVEWPNQGVDKPVQPVENA